ncbi:S1C family serine protease [Solwaraspora sp. WMMD406]|uniref:S1C family serine protease n=1 Tax=Solwaraspora sp. WMMD406 TaxID=3016095 RepID=UPI0024159F09|nr:S1C family serine protease [Solwaraspora sp. WMMD406]MDG4766988.1 S1C family serine protease [Solwaraspora sp. WMMD406]
MTSGFDQRFASAPQPPGPRHAVPDGSPPLPAVDGERIGSGTPAGSAASPGFDQPDPDDPQAASGQPDPVHRPTGSDQPDPARQAGVWGPPHADLLRAMPRRRSWTGVTALLLVVGLGAVVGLQAYRIDQLTTRLAQADQRLDRAQGADASRFDLVEARTAELERQVGAAFDPEAIASAVLPSVFRVTAGRFTGTAFAVGESDDGDTDLFTNYHVIESAYLAGNRRVFLERDGQQIPATIVRVDSDSDVAHLRTARSFTGLVPATGAVNAGQQIVVVGAPLGLADTVTTGVVSALRQSEEGSGPVIQFDAPINPGNSGGPVVNSDKQVVGIAAAKARDAEGIGLAVPIQTACDAFDVC